MWFYPPIHTLPFLLDKNILQVVCILIPFYRGINEFLNFYLYYLIVLITLLYTVVVIGFKVVNE